MNDVERLAAARAGLRSQIEALVGPGPIEVQTTAILPDAR